MTNPNLAPASLPNDARSYTPVIAQIRDLVRLKLLARLNCAAPLESLERTTFLRIVAVLHRERGIEPREELGALVDAVCDHVVREHHLANARATPATPATAAILGALSERDRHLLRVVLLEGRDPQVACAELGVAREYLPDLIRRARRSQAHVGLSGHRTRGGLSVAN